MSECLVIDYGCGNLASIVRMCERIGKEAAISKDPSEIHDAKRLVLAGVGAFDYGMKNLRENQWEAPLREAVLERGVPVLGICLGMQLFAKRSEEGGEPGLGWIDAEVIKFNFPDGEDRKVPHMGWNTVKVQRENRLIPSESEQRFYFVHSYHVVCAQEADVTGRTNYGIDFTSAFVVGNIFGVQFHPEKSHRFGMEVFTKFFD